MLRFVFFIIQIILLISIVSFVIKKSFIVSFEINDLIYSVSSVYFLITFFLIFITIFLIQYLYFKIKFKLSYFRLFNIIKKKERGYESFVQGMIAIAGNDYKKAVFENNKVNKFLKKDSSLSLLLNSEVFKHEKKFDELSIVYEQMAKYKTTQNLAFRGLMEQYLRSQDYHHAFIYAEKLFNTNPNIEKLYETLVNIIVKTNNWHQLSIISEKAFNKKIIDKKTYEENTSIAFYEIARIKKLSDLKDAENYILKAIKLRKNFPPYNKFYLDILIQDRKYDLAKNYSKKIWKENPHPEYKDCFFDIADNLKINILDLSKFIIGSMYNHYQSKVLMIESSIFSKNWNLARGSIESLIDIKPSKEVCLLMAKIEEGDTGDINKSNSWNFRSKDGDINETWVCMISNKYQDKWTSVSNEGYFNSLVWKQPYMLNQISTN